MTKIIEPTSSLYEVIDQNVHRYSTTSVSGGGSDMHGNIQNIQSSVTRHSEQELWVKNVDSGKERKLEFNSFNVDARPGHKLLLIWDAARDNLERVINLDTEIKYHAGGAYNDWDTNHHFLRSKVGRVLNAVFISACLLIPFLGWFIGVLLGLGSILSGSLYGHRSLYRAGINRLHAAFGILIIAAHMMVTFPDLWYSIVVGSGLWWIDYGLNGFMILGHQIHMQVAEFMGYTSSWIRWGSLTAGLYTYLVVVTWWVNRVNGKRILSGSAAIDAHSKDVKSTHPALQH
ncbi:hypothetical protein [Marinimicrobium alkaliphilum]|uniref:hypothetical protein n=1 Tax=Marinimicrobium alkaliphilum TaxID=2202654 RepID=UPI000DB92C3A|nr:hypothetical protein [Marinimicrobium alkaliphilum]